MTGPDEFLEAAEQYRGQLVAHCYRMLGSLHDAEDVVQETYLRAWRAYDGFEHRSAVRTWLFRIATRQCLNLVRHTSRRLVPSAVGAPGDVEDIDGPADIPWLEPFPDLMFISEPADPGATVAQRETLRLALVAAVQYLPPRQRAVLLLRDVLAWPAAEVAAALDTSVAAVNSALQRARAELARIHPRAEDVGEPAEPERRALLDRYAEAFERADLAALEELFTADVTWEMPPIATWMAGRDAVLRLLKAKIGRSGTRRLLPVQANGGPGFAMYTVGADGVSRGYALQALTLRGDRIAGVMSFHSPQLFPAFGMPPVLETA
ncbi:sigma-70 family RNA polymerase sigma factor [Pseudonocardia sp. CA-107938]|uniref:sigma-70 family RNA polymerase sigma factor n=1 Tax=Pseudonocardia sp. CA-107938 TaxID=3240021 RepID=UPI003D8F55D2